MQNKVDKTWARKHSEILKYVFSLYRIDKFEFAKEVLVSDATVRQWMSGRGFPDSKNLNALYGALEKKVNNSTNVALNVEMENYLTDSSQSLDSDFVEYDPSRHNLGQYLVAKLNGCYAKGKQLLTPALTASNIFKPSGFTRAVVFDFDGTLTEVSSVRTTWESIWVALGYDVQECRDLHTEFDKKRITHEQWCDLTTAKFKAKNLHRDCLSDIADSIKLIHGCHDVFHELHKRFIKIFIVSGSILFVIQKVINGLYKYVDDVKANDFKFSSCGILTEIIGTKFDFEGKASYITNIANNLRVSPDDILFVGNSYNDKYAYLSGARTLCINPKDTDPSNFTVWNDCIYECTDLTQILKFVRFPDEHS